MHLLQSWNPLPWNSCSTSDMRKQMSTYSFASQAIHDTLLDEYQYHANITSFFQTNRHSWYAWASCSASPHQAGESCTSNTGSQLRWGKNGSVVTSCSLLSSLWCESHAVFPGCYDVHVTEIWSSLPPIHSHYLHLLFIQYSVQFRECTVVNKLMFLTYISTQVSCFFVSFLCSSHFTFWANEFSPLFMNVEIFFFSIPYFVKDQIFLNTELGIMHHHPFICRLYLSLQGGTVMQKVIFHEWSSLIGSRLILRWHYYRL